MGGNKTMNYITGGLQTAAGAAATAFGAPEIGIPLMTSGIGGIAGQGAGGTKGFGMGEGIGAVAGGLGEGIGGMGPAGGFLGPGSTLNEGARSFFGMGPSGAKQLQQLSGAIAAPGGVPGASDADKALMQQSISGLMEDQYPNAPGAPGSSGGQSSLSQLAQLAGPLKSLMGSGGSDQPPPPPPQMPPKPAPPGLTPMQIQPATARQVPKPGIGAGGGGDDLVEKMALLRRLGGSGVGLM